MAGSDRDIRTNRRNRSRPPVRTRGSRKSDGAGAGPRPAGDFHQRSRRTQRAGYDAGSNAVAAAGYHHEPDRPAARGPEERVVASLEESGDAVDRAAGVR